MISLVHACLDIKQHARITDVRFDFLRHFVQVFEQIRVDLLKSLRDRISIVYDVIIRISVICIDHDLDGISDIVCSGFIVVRFRIRIIGRMGVRIDDPVQFAVLRNHIRVFIIAEIRHYFLHSFGNFPIDEDLGIALDVAGNQRL